MIDVADLAEEHHGIQTWGFSQGKIGVFLHFYFKSKTFGICMGLAAEWIKHHANGGSLANVLGGGGVGSLNIGKLHQVAKLQTLLMGEYPEQGFDRWMLMNDILPLSRSKRQDINSHRFQGWVGASHRISPGVEQDTPVAGIADEIADALVGLRSCYARISFGGKAFGTQAGHSIAVWLGAQDAVLFDPNHGEFWFEDRSDLGYFFPRYYRKCYLSGMMNFNLYWHVYPYAKRIL